MIKNNNNFIDTNCQAENMDGYKKFSAGNHSDLMYVYDNNNSEMIASDFLKKWDDTQSQLIIDLQAQGSTLESSIEIADNTLSNALYYQIQEIDIKNMSRKPNIMGWFNDLKIKAGVFA